MQASRGPPVPGGEGAVGMVEGGRSRRGKSVINGFSVDKSVSGGATVQFRSVALWIAVSCGICCGFSAEQQNVGGSTKKEFEICRACVRTGAGVSNKSFLPPCCVLLRGGGESLVFAGELGRATDLPYYQRSTAYL